MKCVVILHRENLRILRCIGKTEFCYSINWKPWISPWERAEMTWKASEGTRFAGFAAVREEEWACLLGLAASMHPHPHAAAPLPMLPFPVLQAKQEVHSLLTDLRSLLSQASTNSARANGVQLPRCPHGRQVPTPRIGAWYHLLNAYSNILVITACMSTIEKYKHAYSI